MLPGPYNNNVQLVQTPDYVAIVNEMIHDVRIVPMNGQPRVGQQIHRWMGDARGHWEGNTLVIETVNFTAERNFRGAGENLQLVERFTRVDDNTIKYEFTVSDPNSYTQPWSAMLPLSRTQGPVYEYACHEGNYSMTNILAGARANDKANDNPR